MADRTKGVLLDSSVVIAYLRARLDLRQRVAPDEPLFLPLVALGELYKGAFKSTRPAQNLQQIVNEQIKLTHYRACKLTHPGQKKGGDQDLGGSALG